jgi:hypothetical protein
VELGDALDVTLEVVQALQVLEIPYLLGGSLASSFYGIPRATQDADIAADLAAHHVPPLVSMLRDRFYLDQERALQAVRRRTSFNLIHLGTNLKVDVFVLDDQAFSRSEMARRRSFPMSGDTNVTFQVASPEDVVLQKLRWFRLGGEVSQQQWSDLLGVLKVQRSRLDSDYLARWSAQLGVDDLLAKAVGEAGLG